MMIIFQAIWSKLRVQAHAITSHCGGYYGQPNLLRERATSSVQVLMHVVETIALLKGSDEQNPMHRLLTRSLWCPLMAVPEVPVCRGAALFYYSVGYPIPSECSKFLFNHGNSAASSHTRWYSPEKSCRSLRTLVVLGPPHYTLYTPASIILES